MKRSIPYILFGIVGVIAIYATWMWFIDQDEIQHLHSAWLLGQGLSPFKDFFEHHGPVFWYILSPLVNLTSNPFVLVVSMRILNLILLAVLIFIFFRKFARLLFPDADWRWAAILLASTFMFFQKAFELRPDLIMQFLSFAGFYAWASFLMKEKNIYALISGVLFGIAFVILQKAAVAMALVGLTTFVLAIIHFRDAKYISKLISGGALFALSAFIPIAVYFGVIIASGGWDGFYFWNFTFNKYLFLVSKEGLSFGFFEKIGRSLGQSPMIWIAGMAGMAGALVQVLRSRKTWDGRHDCIITLLAVAIGSLVFMAKSRFMYAQYLIGFFLILGLFAVSAINRILKCHFSVTAVLVFLMVVLFGVISFLFPTNTKQRAIYEYVLANTDVADVIAVPPPFHPIFRKDAGYFWFNAALMAAAYDGYSREHPELAPLVSEDIRRWKEKPPAFVYIDPEDSTVHPIKWSEFSVDYGPTKIPNLYKKKGF